jgi:hypothetical protein|tara:strand:+ start:9231 stop:11051 length:1821 start_codon:yes stop_codon:yes gene_type:complete
MAKKINYISRNFVDTREELIGFVKQYYPSILSDFNDASVGMMFIELNAAVADMLSFNTDRAFQETQIDFAQEEKSVRSLARTFGLKVPGKRPSISMVDFSVTVPVFGDSFDLSYAPVIRRGAQVTGAGKVFETLDDIDFSNPFTTGGLPNRQIIPNFDTNGNTVNYTLVKREVVLNGSTKIFKRVIQQEDVKSFLEIVLPDDDVLSIDSVITLEGTSYTKTPSLDQFYNIDNRWFEVDALAEDKVFIEDTTATTDNAGVKPGKFVRVPKRFIREYTDNGFTKVILGGGNQDTGALCDFGLNPSFEKRIGDFINNQSLGETPTANKTMFIQYRVGGGASTNIGSKVLTKLGNIDIIANGPDSAINAAVVNSLEANNPIPALGGRNEPSVEEIRNLVRYNFASQNRAVTINDYRSRIALMPGEFGVPFRNGVWESQNKVLVSILGLDETGKLSNSSTNTLRTNIATYLSDYRMLNDYVEIANGKIYNLGFEVDLFIDKQFPQSQIINETINSITRYMDINNFDMGDNIFLSQLLEIINNVGGVLNVVDLRVYNKVGNNVYSLNEVSQPYSDAETKQIDLLGQFTLFGEPNAMFEVRVPIKDILVRVKN